MQRTIRNNRHISYSSYMWHCCTYNADANNTAIVAPSFIQDLKKSLKMPLFGNTFSPKKTPPRKSASLSSLHTVSLIELSFAASSSLRRFLRRLRCGLCKGGCSLKLCYPLFIGCVCRLICCCFFTFSSLLVGSLNQRGGAGSWVWTSCDEHWRSELEIWRWTVDDR